MVLFKKKFLWGRFHWAHEVLMKFCWWHRLDVRRTRGDKKDYSSTAPLWVQLICRTVLRAFCSVCPMKYNKDMSPAENSAFCLTCVQCGNITHPMFTKVQRKIRWQCDQCIPWVLYKLNVMLYLRFSISFSNIAENQLRDKVCTWIVFGQETMIILQSNDDRRLWLPCILTSFQKFFIICWKKRKWTG